MEACMNSESQKSYCFKNMYQFSIIEMHVSTQFIKIYVSTQYDKNFIKKACINLKSDYCQIHRKACIVSDNSQYHRKASINSVS
jgi:hypothetical protein